MVNSLLQPGSVYHIWSHAVSKDNLFLDKENYRFFLSRYFKYTSSILSTHAYCLMPNHIHFMVRVLESEMILNHPKNKKLKKDNSSTIPQFLSKQVGNMFNSYTKSFNKYHYRRGSLFERPFGRSLIQTEEYFTQLVIYIHRNPVTHGFVNDIYDWPYSSWNSYVNKMDDQLDKNEVLEWFGGLDFFIRAHTDVEDNKFGMFET